MHLIPLLKRFVLLTLIAAAHLSSVGAAWAASTSTTQELLFLTWDDYIDPDVVKAFESKFKVKVKQVYFESDDARDDMLVESEGRGYDVVVVNSPAFPLYWKRSWLAPLDETAMPNLRHIDARWAKALPVAAGYGAPYCWGTTGIAYRADLVPAKITRWQQLFQPAEALRGKIVMPKNARDITGMALKALGHSANSTDANELDQAERLLLAQKPFVKSYSYVSLDKDSELVSGQVWVAMMYNGDVLQLKEHNPNIVYTVPDEGSELWIDYLTILQASPRKRLAMDFINFLNEPENAARIARFVRYATPNKAAERLLPAEFLQDRDIYPSEEVLKKSEFYIELPPRVAKRRNSLFARVLQ